MIKPTAYAFSIIFLIIMGIILQAHIYLSHDVAWHVLITERLLQGGSYTHDFMDISPPLIMYSKIPVIGLMQLCNLSMPSAVRLYLFVLMVCSLLLCHRILSVLYERRPAFRRALMMTLTFILFCLPLFELGQRDDLVLVLLLPYIFTYATTLQKQPLPFRIRILTAIAAGIGFLIHLPYFLIFIIIDGYFLYKEKAARLLEVSLIFLIALLYVVSILVFTPDYFTFVLPLVSWIYLDMYNNHWPTMIWSLPAIGVYCTLATVLLIKKKTEHTALLTMLSGILLLVFIPYLYTAKLWYYHMLPTLACTLLILAIVWTDALQAKRVTAVCLISTLYVFPLFQFGLAVQQSLLAKKETSELSQWIHYVKENDAGHSIYVFSAYMWPELLTAYAGVNIASRFAPAWLPIGIVNKEKTPLNDADKHRLANIKRFLLEATLDDLVKYKPTLILVDEANQSSVNPTLSIDFLSFFNQDSRFSKLLSQYHCAEHRGNYRVCRMLLARTAHR